MLEKAKELPFKRLICQPIDKFENQEIFDVIVCVGVLDFIADLDNLFLRLKKNLHQKSLFGFTVPETPNDGLVGLDLQETRQLFSRTGFEVLKQEKIHGYTDSASGKVVEYWIILAQAL
ncbi:hypothetical protein EDD86DRAFT_272354 [Gorgonomyces haynaldii]|nr:hypothetical protein EDD86DRAFT_272354 [Gorgonomyces haynaldii]